MLQLTIRGAAYQLHSRESSSDPAEQSLMVEVDGRKQQAGAWDGAVESAFALLDDFLDRRVGVGFFAMTDN